MKKTQPSFNHNLPTLDLLTVQLVAGGNTTVVTDAAEATAPMQTTSSNETSTIPSGYGSRPPFN